MPMNRGYPYWPEGGIIKVRDPGNGKGYENVVKFKIAVKGKNL